MALTTPPIHTQKPSERGERFKRGFAQSTYITVAWTWFLVLAGKAAEPVLVVSVLYASLKLLPIVHFPPQFDAVVFVAQFVALDVGGLSLNKLADQAFKDGNIEGARQAKWLSIALVSVMLAGVIIAGVDQVVKLDDQISIVIDTVLLIARAIMAVLYSRVIHALKSDDLFEIQQPYSNALDMQKLIAALLQEALVTLAVQMKADQVAFFKDLSQQQERLFHLLDGKQQSMLATLTEQTQALAMLHPEKLAEAAMSQMIQPTVASLAEPETHRLKSRETKRDPQTAVPAEPALLLETLVPREPRSHKTSHLGTSGRGQTEHQVDAIVWSLLDAGKTVRGIEAETGIKKATVGRSRLRWTTARNLASVSKHGTELLSHESLSDEVLACEPGEEDTS